MVLKLIGWIIVGLVSGVVVSMLVMLYIIGRGNKD